MLTCMQRNIHNSMSVSLIQWTMMITWISLVIQVKKSSRENSGLDSSATTSRDLNAEQIANIVLKRIGHMFPTYKEESHSQARLPEQLGLQWVHREPTRSVMGTQSLTLGTKSLGDIGIGSFERRVESSSFQPYHRAREPHGRNHFMRIKPIPYLKKILRVHNFQ